MLYINSLHIEAISVGICAFKGWPIHLRILSKKNRNAVADSASYARGYYMMGAPLPDNITCIFPVALGYLFNFGNFILLKLPNPLISSIGIVILLTFSAHITPRHQYTIFARICQKLDICYDHFLAISGM